MRIGKALGIISFAIVVLMAAPAPSQDESKYRFTQDWVSKREKNWMRVLGEFKGKPNIHGLEVGSFEGRSAIWFLDNILTTPTSTMTCIDVFANWLVTMGAEQRFDHNIEVSGHAARVEKIKGFSHPSLRALPVNHYDFIYIDGCHDAPCVLLDLMLSWDLLKSGGILILDDYGYYPKRAKLNRPAVSIDAFLEIFEEKIELIHKEYQVIVRKK